MSLTVQNKYQINKKKNSKFIVNFSLNIPVGAEKLRIDKPVSGQFQISPSFPKKSLKIKLGSARTTQEPSSRKLSITAQSNQVTSARNQRKISQKSTARSPAVQSRHTKNLSFPNSKSPSMILSKPIRASNSVNQSIDLQILNSKIMQSADDDIIGYTNPSSQLCRQDQDKLNTNKKSFFQIKRQRTIITPPFGIFRKNQIDDAELISQVKRIEVEANQKKKQLNFQYIKQKILMQACARKIQRAWRNYKTKQLLHVYSHNLSIKYSNKMKNNWIETEPKILNVKSCGYKSGQNQMKRNLKEYKQMELQERQKKKKVVTLQEKKKAQLSQQIQKWQELIKRLRKNKNVDQVLEKVQQQKVDLVKVNENQIQNLEQNTQNQQDPESSKLHNTILKIQNQQTKKQIQQAFSKFQGTKKQQKGSVTPEAKSIKPDLEVKKIQTLQSQQKQRKQKKRKKIFSSYPKIQKQEEIQQQAIQRENLNKLKVLRIIPEKQQTSVIYKLEAQIIGGFISNIILQITDQAKRRSLLYELKQLKKDILQRDTGLERSRNRIQKEEGICTNMESVKDYLQNLVSYVFEQCPQILIDNLNTPKQRFLFTNKKLNQSKGQKSIQSKPDLVMPKRIFNVHWEYASQQIYFQKKFQNVKLQSERVFRLKKITKVSYLLNKTFFQSIFDSFNQCLEFERMYGENGQPYAWQRKVYHKFDILATIEMVKPKVKSAFKRLSQMASIFCGMLAEDKSVRISEQVKMMIKQVKQDIKQERLNLFLEYEVLKQGSRWMNCRDQITQTLFKLSNYIFENVILQTCIDIFNIELGIKDQI